MNAISVCAELMVSLGKESRESGLPVSDRWMRVCSDCAECSTELHLYS